ncbi:MAG: hypothetical protein JW837_12880, partial [Sedimentisphaerales bacterium]|nr:hypothetical protein [Sedimentisphaerales bacterium]
YFRYSVITNTPCKWGQYNLSTCVRHLFSTSEPLKIAFVMRTSEIFSGKAEGQNRRRRSQSYVEDVFWPDNAAGGNCSRSK